jgi:hypothetical protein
MRPLVDKTNVQAPDSDYPFGRIKDNPGNGTGTPVNELVYGDIHQFFEKMMHESGITPNGLPENDYSGFQLFQALQTVILLHTQKDQLSFALSGGGSVINTGERGNRRVPFKCRIIGWEATAQQSGSIAVDIWRDTYGNFPPTNGDSIVTPMITAAVKGQATGLDIVLEEGDYLLYNVDSVTSINDVTITLIVERIFTFLDT